MKRSSGLRVGVLTALALVLLLSGGGMQLDLRANGGPATLTTWGIPAPDSLPLGVAIDEASGQVYFAEAGGDKIGRLDPASNLITEWAAGDGPNYLALDISTGNVSIYFTEGLGNRVSRLIPSLNGYSFATVPTADSWPNGVALSFIGMTLLPSDIWFTERLGNKLGRLRLGGLLFDVVVIAAPSQRVIAPSTQAVSPTTRVVTPAVTATWGSPALPPPLMVDPGVASGPFTEWPLALGPGHPAMIARGPAGDLWISTETKTIIQFDPGTNAFIPHGLPSGSASLDLVVDSAGFVWFTEGWEDKLGRLEPTTGMLSEWPLSSGSQPFAIAIGPDGTIWFSEREGDRIGNLDPATNTITEYQLASDAHPLDITFDGAGNLWFTTERANYVGRLAIGPVLGPPPTLFDSIGLAEIMAASLSPAKINGSDNASNQIPTGTILLYQTNEGRYGKLEIVEYGYDLTLKWRTYNPDGSLYSGGDHLVIRGTWTCDLDRGVETTYSNASRDFSWEQVTAVERYLAPKNGARFAIYGAAPPPPSGLPTLNLSIDRGCGANYNPGEPLAFSYSVSETAAVTLLDFETSGNIKQMALGTVPAGMTRSGTGVVTGPAGVETLVLVARTLSGVYVSTGCSFGIGGVNPSLVSVTVDRGCNGTYRLGETATVTLQSGVAGQVRLWNVTRDGQLAQIPVSPQMIAPGLQISVSAPFSGAIGRNTLVMQVITGSGVLTSACSTNVLP